MEIVPRSNGKVLSLHSEFVGKSQMRVRVRALGRKLMVDVTELTPDKCSKRRASKMAIQAAKLAGASSADCINLGEQELVRHTKRIDGVPVRTVVRQTTFAFEAVE